MSHYEPLTDQQWLLLEPLFPRLEKRGRGKPHTPWRGVLNSILFVLTTGSKWSALPKTPDFASKSASHRWFVLWDKNGVIDQILSLLNQFAPEAHEFSFPLRRQRGPKAVEQPLEMATV